jgi:hypothetical protein
MNNPPRKPGAKGWETLDFAKRRDKNRRKRELAKAAKRKQR